MRFLVDFYQKNQTVILILAALALVAAGICLIKRKVRKRQKYKELEQARADKVRDENLNHVILNQHAGRHPKEVHTPYDVDYGSQKQEGHTAAGIRDGKDQDHSVMIRLIEKTELSVRKFVLNPAKGIRIGSDLQKNDITVLAEGVAPCQCEIFSAKNRVYIRNIVPGNETIVRRRKEQTIVGEKGVRLLSEDTVVLGKVSYDITIID